MSFSSVMVEGTGNFILLLSERGYAEADQGGIYGHAGSSAVGSEARVLGGFSNCQEGRTPGPVSFYALFVKEHQSAATLRHGEG
jgi:hypothetical protein